MPGKIKVKVLAGRNLPVMDRAGDTTDAFVEIKFGGVTHKTDVCRKSLNPQWNSTEWYRFEVDESELQDEPLQLRLMDHDTYSANDAIGKVVISLAPLLAREASSLAYIEKAVTHQNNAVMSGWIPVFDTMHGIRGELNVIVKVELFSDLNKYKTSSCGVQFFHCPTIPPGYRVTSIHGFVEELVVNDDPEYQWIDKIRTPRASNEARQVAFIKLSNQVQRLVGLKAVELGANAVVGYQQEFDLEGEAGVVARAIGTAVSIVPLPVASQPQVVPPCSQQSERENKLERERSPRHARHESYGAKDLVGSAGAGSSMSGSAPVGILRRSSESDLSTPPKGGSLNAAQNTGGGDILRPSMNSNNLDMLEHPFLTMTEYPPGFIVHLGGCVCARSVKLVDGGGDSDSRAAWWAELRTEMRSHARAARCNTVLGYAEVTTICEDVCVLSASGTAAVINLDCDYNAEIDGTVSVQNISKLTIDEYSTDCSIAHVPYAPDCGPYRPDITACGACRRARVPAVMLSTCAKPKQLVSYGKAIPIFACAARVRRAPPRSEPGARDISDQLPFLEYELHKLLLAKVRMQGANAVFNLRTRVTIGDRCVSALAYGSAYKLDVLPPVKPPTIKSTEDDKEAADLQKSLWDTFIANQKANGYDTGPDQKVKPLTENIDDDRPLLDLCSDKDACILEIDESEDVETARALAVRRQNALVFTNDLRPILGAAPQAFTQIWRSRLVLTQGHATSAAERHVCRAIDGSLYRLRRMKPFAIHNPTLHVELPDDEIQLVITGTAIPLRDQSEAGQAKARDNEDSIFLMEDESDKDRSFRENVDNVTEAFGSCPSPRVILTSLCTVSGARIVKRICALRLLFVRETTAVREMGGVSGFLHTFTCEVLAIVRASTAALGGNALTSFYITQLMLQDNAHKNQGQCLLSVGGDVVHLSF